MNSLFLSRVIRWVFLAVYFVIVGIGIYGILIGKLETSEIKQWVGLLLSGAITMLLLWKVSPNFVGEIYKTKFRGRSRVHPPQQEHHTAIRLLKLLLPSDEALDNIIGDLLEEYEQFQSKVKADIWLYRQAFKSIIPLLYRVIKSYFASLFGEHVS